MENAHIKIRYIVPALILAAVLASGPVIGLMGTTELARLIFVTLLGIIAVVLYHVRSWRKQAGISLIALGVEFAILVIIYFNPRFPLRYLVAQYLAKYADLVWQATIGLSAVFLITGALILLWGHRAHKNKDVLAN